MSMPKYYFHNEAHCYPCADKKSAIEAAEAFPYSAYVMNTKTNRVVFDNEKPKAPGHFFL